ncbi:MAG TPA: methyltransferase [Polyangia bacterium]|nr:methyltransferase [Polyangia bacterium]
MSDLELDLRGGSFPSGPGMLELMTSGYLLSSVLFSAVELGVFDQLESRPADAEQLAVRLRASVNGTRRLLTALCALALCRRDDDGVHYNTPIASAALTSGAPQSIVPLVLQHQRLVFDLFGRLTDGVRSGEPQLAAWRFVDGAPAADCYAELQRHPEEQALLMRAMNRASLGVGRAMAKQAGLGDARELIDLGGGGAQVAIELCESLPQLSVVIVDLPAACRHAQARVQAAGFERRIRCVAGDLRRPLDDRVTPADAVLLSGVISDFPEAERALVLRHAAQAVARGGRLLVSETLLDDARTGPALPALLSLFMLLSTRGDNFTLPELRALLAQVGFPDLDFHSGAKSGLRDLIVARRAS